MALSLSDASLLFGSNAGSGGTSVQSLDLSSLYGSKTLGRLDTPIVKPKSFDTPAVNAPWTSRSAAKALRDRVNDLKGERDFLALDSAQLASTKSNKDLKATFSLYKALDNLKAIADYAGDKNRTASERADLDKLFRKGFAQLQSYADSADTRQLNLLFGEKKTRAQSVVLPGTQTSYTGTGVGKDATTAIDGVKKSDQFIIYLSKSSQSDAIRVDLSTITGDITLDAVVDRINKAIEGTGIRDINGDVLTDGDGNPIPAYGSSFAVTTLRDGKKAITLNAVSTETVSVAAVDPAPSVFVAATYAAGDGKDDVAKLLRLDGNDDGGFDSKALGSVAGVDRAATSLAKAVYDATPAPTATYATKPAAPGDVTRPTRVAASAVDGDGFVWQVSTSSGDLGNARGTQGDDLYLTKRDSNGALIFARRIGAAGASQGAALAIDADNNVIVAGVTDAQLGSKNIFKGQDTLVAKYDSSGKQIFAVALDSLATDRATSVVTDADGNIYVGGTVIGALKDQSQVGGADATLFKLSGRNGEVLAQTQFGTTGDDAVASLALDGDGKLLVAGNESGEIVLRRFDPANIGAGSSNRVSLGSGTAVALKRDADSGALVLGSTGSSGDVIVSKLDNDFNVTNSVTLGTDFGDQLDSLVLAGDKLYLGGRTSGTLGDAKSGSVDGFVAQLDLQTLSTDSIRQFGEPGRKVAYVSLDAVAQGSGVLGKLGLRTGDLRPTSSNDLLSVTGLRAGDSFFVSVNDGTRRKIEIGEGETLRGLASKLRTTFSGKLDARVTGAGALEIRQKGENSIELSRGAEGADVLAKLGIEPAKLYSTKVLFGVDSSSTSKKSDQKPGGTFQLSLTGDLDIADADSARYVSGKLKSAIESVQRAYRSLYFDENRAKSANQVNASGAPAYLRNQLANYSAGLSRLQGSIA